jgi:hypothetical protein
MDCLYNSVGQELKDARLTKAKEIGLNLAEAIKTN